MPLDGSTLSPWLALPFIGMLLSIAVVPLFAQRFWARHCGKVVLFWSVVALAAIGFSQGTGTAIHSVVAVMFEQFIPFIMVLLALFTTTGGIKVHGTTNGSPVVNTLILLGGAISANVIGTAGASVLLIRPLMSANAQRKSKLHTMMFFIFIVGNIGGSLTPIGNPPLLMGYLCNIGFFWPLARLLPSTAFTVVVLLALYYAIESFLCKKEKPRPMFVARGAFRIEGKVNALLLIAVVFVILLSSRDLGRAFTVCNVEMPLALLLEILLLGCITILSCLLSGRTVRAANNFTWHPIIEVGKLFAGIFITMAPLIAMLRAGADGPMRPVVQVLTGPDGRPVNGIYFWLTGLFSGFLDSAPAYVVAFQTAMAHQADPVAAAHVMMTTKAATLVAITAGASFMGALSYIGNAPNMMIKAIAEENGIAMPSFFGYLEWSFGILVPLFVVVQVLFIS